MPEAIKHTENRGARDPMLVTGILGQTVLKEIRRITPIALHTTTLVETAIISDPLGSIPSAFLVSQAVLRFSDAFVDILLLSGLLLAHHVLRLLLVRLYSARGERDNDITRHCLLSTVFGLTLLAHHVLRPDLTSKNTPCVDE